MPEIGEVARLVHYLRKHAVNKVISSVQVQEDNIVYGKVGTTAQAFQTAMTGKKVLDARQQGKYFWLVMSEPPHPVMHLGMTGWIKFSNDDSSYYRKKGTIEAEAEDWPPRFWKFILHTEDKHQIAFVDPRRLARIRLVDAAGEDLRKTSPLKENGPDPVIDKDVLTVDWLSTKLHSKRVPVKALLLDQANISGVGNWVADEVLYQSRIHPEQYSNTFSEKQVAELHKALMHVCDTACGTLADSEKFPDTWLMRYRWDMGKKDKNVLPNGDKIVHLKVGGRTSAIVPRVQKKTGKVAGDVSGAEESAEEQSSASEEASAEEVKPKRGKASKATKAKQAKAEIKAEEPEDTKPKRATRTKRKASPEPEVKDEGEGEEEEEQAKPAKKARSTKTKEVNGSTDKKTAKPAKTTKPAPTPGSRRSGRLSGQGV